MNASARASGTRAASASGETISAISTPTSQWVDAYMDHGLVLAKEDGNPFVPNGVSRHFEDLQAGITVRAVHERRMARDGL